MLCNSEVQHAPALTSFPLRLVVSFPPSLVSLPLLFFLPFHFLLIPPNVTSYVTVEARMSWRRDIVTLLVYINGLDGV